MFFMSLSFWLSNGNVDGAAFDHRTIECLDSCLGGVSTCEFDEAESSGATGVAICDNASGYDFAVRGEHLTELGVINTPWERTNK